MEIKEKIRSLVAKRGQIKAHVTRLETFLQDFENSDKTVTELTVRLNKVEPLFSDFNEVQSDIELLDESNDLHYDYRINFEESYYSVIARAKQIIDKGSLINSSEHTRNNIPVPQSTKLPVIPIPQFCGDYRDWSNFYDTFNSLVNSNASLTKSQKFYYLKNSLKDEAKQVIESLEVSETNYELALDLLKRRFDNKKLIKRAHVASLFNISNLTKESHLALRKFLDEINKRLRALKNLGEATETWDILLVYLISTKLDVTTKRKWETFSSKFDEFKLEDMLNFLTDRCNILETLTADKDTPDKTFVKKNQKTFTHASVQPNCSFCNGAHFIYGCQNFLKIPIKSRFIEIKKLKLCSNCLHKGHFSTDCKSDRTCKRCNKRHNTLLHFEDDTKPVTNTGSGSNTQPSVEERMQDLSISTHSATNQEPHILLSTAIVCIKDNAGNLVQCRALLDSGSQSNFIAKPLFEKLGLVGYKISIPVSGVGQSITKISHRTHTLIQSLHNGYKRSLSFLVIDSITENIPASSFNKSNIEIPNNLTLADPTFDISGKIDILLGAGVFWDLLCIGQINNGSNKPILQKTKFGWIISGPIYFDNVKNSERSRSFCALSIDDQRLQNQLEQFWRVEEVASKIEFTREEQLCEQIFIDTTIRDKTGRFIVTLPMSRSPNELGDSLDTALKRFSLLEKRFDKNPELKCRYSQFINEYQNLGHMTIIKDVKQLNSSIAFYLPHHGIEKESSSTTKLRVVFDASAKTSTNISLNDILLTGPTVQDELFCILLRFRKHNYVVIADVAKMYRQVLVAEHQRDLQRIVWRDNSQEEIKHFVLNTVTYGTSPASFLAIRCLQQLAHENIQNYPKAAHAILKDFYVDDLLTGSDTIQDTIDLRRDISTILESGGFPLRKWLSNSPDILQDTVSDKDNSQYYIADDKVNKTLGLYWNADSDIIKVTTISTNAKEKITKRSILSTISKIFDPLGLVGPIIIRAKIILQHLWKIKISWDESVPVDIYTKWINLREQIGLLSNLEIPRHVLPLNPINIQLHGFCDASEASFGACLYIRAVDISGNVSSRLLCAKSKVAPLKTLTLPRLELSGALLLSQLANKVMLSLDMHFTHVYYWCDSTIVLSWLASPSYSWKTFVCNRVAEIQKLTSVEQWRHVRSNDNPADIISRGSEPDKLINSRLWWSGPSWLLEDSNHWPNCFQEKPTEMPEYRSTNLIAIDTIEQDIFYKYSSLTKLKRVVAYCLRFKNNAMKKSHKFTGPLTIDELSSAMNRLIKMVQSHEFSKDLANLEKAKSVSHQSKLASLNPFIDDKGILRVGGRLLNSNVSTDHKHPMVLPSNHPFTRLVIDYEHLKHFHAGAQATLAFVRHAFWPLHGRSTVKRVLRNCITCFRVKPYSIFPQMGNLPETRLQPARPFYNSGVDFAGPFYIKDGKTRNRKIIKCYLCIFVCFITKAVHLELVGDLTSDAFLNTLRRFVARRGICKNLFSDNGTNFRGANNELNEISHLIFQIKHEPNLTNFLTQNEINWQFIPARSPHLGGLWEAAVKSAKFHFKRIIGNMHLTYEDLNTIFVQIEAILNSRPLTPISDDPNDLIPLTPGHFIIGDCLTAIPQLDFTDRPQNKLTYYQKLQQVTQHFWKRWKAEYISTLQQRNKWKFPKSSKLAIGDMVLLKNENSPPLAWPLGRIIHLHSGDDNVVRVVSVKTISGVVKRSVTKICVLPIDSPVFDKDDL